MSKFLDRIKNAFEDSKEDNTKKESPKKKAPEPAWKNPLDSMPTANGSNRYAPPGRFEELEAEVAEKNNIIAEENPRPEEEAAQWFTDEEDGQDYEGSPVEEEKSMHQKMYEIATARYNPFSLGGSENCDSDVSCNIGGSEEVHK